MRRDTDLNPSITARDVSRLPGGRNKTGVGAEPPAPIPKQRHDPNLVFAPLLRPCTDPLAGAVLPQGPAPGTDRAGWHRGTPGEWGRTGTPPAAGPQQIFDAGGFFGFGRSRGSPRRSSPAALSQLHPPRKTPRRGWDRQTPTGPTGKLTRQLRSSSTAEKRRGRGGGGARRADGSGGAAGSPGGRWRRRRKWSCRRQAGACRPGRSRRSRGWRLVGARLVPARGELPGTSPGTSSSAPIPGSGTGTPIAPSSGGGNPEQPPGLCCQLAVSLQELPNLFAPRDGNVSPRRGASVPPRGRCGEPGAGSPPLRHRPPARTASAPSLCPCSASAGVGGAGKSLTPVATLLPRAAEPGGPGGLGGPGIPPGAAAAGQIPGICSGWVRGFTPGRG